MKDMGNSGYGVGVLLGTGSSFSLFSLRYPWTMFSSVVQISKFDL